MPTRIQMSRQHPWRAEHPDAVIVDRRSRFGNPYRVVRNGSFMGEPLYKVVTPDGGMVFPGEMLREQAHQVAVERFQRAVEMGWHGLPTPREIREALHDKDVACWCPASLPCHGDWLLAIAAGETP